MASSPEKRLPRYAEHASERIAEFLAAVEKDKTRDRAFEDFLRSCQSSITGCQRLETFAACLKKRGGRFQFTQSTRLRAVTEIWNHFLRLHGLEQPGKPKVAWAS